MNENEFDLILQKRLEFVQEILGRKAKEYALGGDRLYNFKVAARVNDTTPTKALWGMATKHLVSVQDMVYGMIEPNEYLINEKVGDLINYLILLEAVMKESLMINNG